MSKQWYGCQCLRFLTCTQTLRHAIAHGGCTDTLRESTLEVDSRRKIPCSTGDLKPCQYCPSHSDSANRAIPAPRSFKKFMPQTYFLASFLSSSERSQAGSRFTTEGLNETGERKWALKQKMCHCFPLLAFSASTIDIYALGVLLGASIWAPRCSAVWVHTVCVLLMNGVYA